MTFGLPLILVPFLLETVAKLRAPISKLVCEFVDETAIKVEQSNYSLV